MANTYKGRVTGVGKSGDKLVVTCTLNKARLHKHTGQIVFDDDPRDQDNFLKEKLKNREKIAVIFG